MNTMHRWTIQGEHGDVSAVRWTNDAVAPRYALILVHGYGEHMGRYQHVAEHLTAHGAVVYGGDHQGHGRSDGEQALVVDFEDVVADVHRLDDIVRSEHGDLGVVMYGHSMGGMIAARYAQLYGDTLIALVLSAPSIGRLDLIPALLELDELPDTPLDVAVLSRDDAVGAAYAADPLVWHGSFKRPTLEAFASTIKTINAGGSVGDLPMMWIHGESDELVPIDGTRTGIEVLRGARLTERTYPGGRHEMHNEVNRDEVLRDVTSFIDDVLRAPRAPTISSKAVEQTATRPP